MKTSITLLLFKQPIPHTYLRNFEHHNKRSYVTIVQHFLQALINLELYVQTIATLPVPPRSLRPLWHYHCICVSGRFFLLCRLGALSDPDLDNTAFAFLSFGFAYKIRGFNCYILFFLNVSLMRVVCYFKI